MLRSSLSFAIAGVLAAYAPLGKAQNAPQSFALQCGHLIDTAAGKVLGATTILTEAGRIKEVLAGSSAPAGTKVVDLSNQTCMPGLIDSHTHLSSQTSPSQYV